MLPSVDPGTAESSVAAFEPPAGFFKISRGG